MTILNYFNNNHWNSLSEVIYRAMYEYRYTKRKTSL